ncbi:MAG TPA: hypothetical protein PKU97_15360, partial [Kofleriaceae bacterium]|nr:hypothetical protein [Kofleriaceae bacterium]
MKLQHLPLGIFLAIAAAACGGGDAGGGADAAMPDASIDSPSSAARFSFFATSLGTMRSQSGSMDGFGGNLGGLIGADRICQNAAAAVGAGGKTWRAFLSTYNGGTPVHAISR